MTCPYCRADCEAIYLPIIIDNPHQTTRSQQISMVLSYNTLYECVNCAASWDYNSRTRKLSPRCRPSLSPEEKDLYYQLQVPA